MRGLTFQNLPVRVLEFSPQTGEQGDRLTAILDRCPDLLDLNLKIGVGMKVMQTIPWVSREYSQLSASIPPYHETGWHDHRVPLYIISLGDDNGVEVPIQSCIFGHFVYKIPAMPIDSQDHNFTQSLSSLGFNSALPLNSDMQCFGLNNFSQEMFSAGRPHSLHQEVLQRVEAIHPTTDKLSQSEPTLQEAINLGYNTQFAVPGDSIGPPFMNDLFFMPTYQPRLRMSTYTTHLRSSLESADYFPQTFPSDNPPMWLMSETNQPEQPVVTSTSVFPSEGVQSCSSYNAELGAIIIPGSSASLAPTLTSRSPTASSSSISSPPVAAQKKDSPVTTPTTKLESETPALKRKRKETTVPCQLEMKLPDNSSTVPSPGLRPYPTLKPKPPSAGQLPPLRRSSASDAVLPPKPSLYPSKHYHGVLNRADLVLLTEVSVMVNNWSAEEKQAGRRLLQFQRRHRDNTLYCQFEPISFENYKKFRGSPGPSDEAGSPPRKEMDQMIISVIRWTGPPVVDGAPEEAFYITSVDLVNLLEGLLGVMFTLEEKNRIRRNLELFGPITVGKASPRTGDLFRQIMAFPSPRPRNIEKGIKVFPYDRIPQALRKVVGKHTASRSSTLKVNLLPLGPSAPFSFEPAN